ncbi:Crp/Fnr family transcriptional regulator [Methylorubrum podarium]|uniref:Crp/Fnr family transcriptional regulator n=1 Tax=Methylorubrum podarium TaxID=200476 RepID=A0ABV1QP77_9HYPH
MLLLQFKLLPLSTALLYHNRLLASLAEDDLASLSPHLEPVGLRLGTVLIEPDQPICHAFFPEQGLGSVVANSQSGSGAEIGLVGRDGFVGTSLVLGSDRIPHQIFMQVGGHGHRISADALRQAFEASPTLRSLLLCYVQTFLIQTAQTALANASAPVEERLARWLLMYHDRQEGDELSITHEFLSLMLGVRRPTVTVALQMLEGARLIQARRGRVIVLNRAGLEEAAGEAYGPAEAEYARLISPLRRTA